MYTDIILAISTVFLAIFTLVLAVFTYNLWSEAKKTREYNIELNKPELSVIFQPSKKYINFININIKNIGNSPIYNLKLKKVENDFAIPHLGKKPKISELKYNQLLVEVSQGKGELKTDLYLQAKKLTLKYLEDILYGTPQEIRQVDEIRNKLKSLIQN